MRLNKIITKVKFNITNLKYLTFTTQQTNILRVVFELKRTKGLSIFNLESQRAYLTIK